MFDRRTLRLVYPFVTAVGLAASFQSAGAKSPASAPALPAPTGTVINVSTEAQLQSAMHNLASNTTIVIAPGTYNLTSTLYVNGSFTNVGIRGGSADPNATVLVGPGMTNASYGNTPYGIWTGTNVQGVLIANLTLRQFYDHAIIFNAGTQSPHVYNVHLLDTGEQLIKSNPNPAGGGVNNGIVEYSTLEYTTTAPSDYTNGVDVHTGSNWIIRHNLFRNIVAPPGLLAGPSVLMWNHSSGTIVEGNTFVNCARAIAFGLDNLSSGTDHSGGIIRNNFIYRAPNQPGDVGISVADSPNSQVVNNSVLLSGTYGTPIEYRFAATTGVVIENNLLDGVVYAREGATGTVSHNATASASMFVNPSTGDLHLKATATSAIDTGATLASVTDDWDGAARPAGSGYDIGADEYAATTTTYTISGHIADGSNTAVSGATVALTGSRSGSTSTSSTGSYSFTGLAAGGSYTVTPTKSGSVFSPASLTYSSLAANQTSANFTTSGVTSTPSVSITAPAGGSSYSAPATLTITAAASSSTATISRVDFYAGTTLVGSDTASPYSVSWSNVVAGTYALTARATDSNGMVSTSAAVNVTVNTATVTSSPYGGAPVSIPGTIQAEDYDLGGEGVAYHDTTSGNAGGAYRTDNVDITTTTDTGGGYLVGWAVAGEWLNYTVNVKTAGAYTFAARVASTGSGGAFHVLVNGVNVTGTMTVPNTGGWQTFQTVTQTGLTLAAGPQVVCVVLDTNGGTGAVANFNWFQFTAAATTTTVSASLTAPASSATFTAPASITVSANASTTSGTISKVDFYSGPTLIGTDTTSPYSITWSNVAAGSYSLTAKATTSGGATATSSAAAITVNSSVVTPPPAGRLQASNLVHVGTFTVPKGLHSGGSANAGFDYGGSALCLSASGGLYLTGHSQDEFMGEISIPGTSGAAALKQALVDPTEGKRANIGPDGAPPSPTGGCIVNSKGQLVFSVFSSYDATGAQTLSHFTRPATLATQGQVVGPVRVGPLGAGFYSGYMAPVPPEWQAALGGPALTGNADLSIISRTSYGPAAAAFDPANISGSATLLVGYPTAHQTLGAWNAVPPGPYFGMADRLTAMVFPNGTSTVLFFVWHGTTACYGDTAANGGSCGSDPVQPYKGVHGYPYEILVEAYDANDLAAVKAGQKNPWDLTPYASWVLPELGMNQLGGAAYDPSTKRIYVSQLRGDADGVDPLIHVYQIQ